MKHQRSVDGNAGYLQRDVLPEGDVSRHREVVELQHVRDALEPSQKLLNLQNQRHKTESVLKTLLMSSAHFEKTPRRYLNFTFVVFTADDVQKNWNILNADI